jgi:hypothetical protein
MNLIKATASDLYAPTIKSGYPFSSKSIPPDNEYPKDFNPYSEPFMI